MGVAYAIQLALNPGPSPVSRILLVVGTPTVTGLLVARLLRGAAGRERAQPPRAARPPTTPTPRWSSTGRWSSGTRPPSGYSDGRRRRSWGATSASWSTRPRTLPAFRERLRALRDAEEVTGFAFETEYRRPDGTTFPAAVTVSRVEGGAGQPILASFARDLTDERRREAEQAQLASEQAARREAEHVAEMVSGMQLLVDAALAHTTTEGMMDALIPRVRAVLDADAASVLLREEGEDVLDGPRLHRWRPRQPPPRRLRRVLQRHRRGRAPPDARAGPAGSTRWPTRPCGRRRSSA